MVLHIGRRGSVTINVGIIRENTMPVIDIEVIVGTYEEFLLGYQVIKKGNTAYRLVQSFADHSHRASIRSVCAKGKFLASGSADETINLYDMKARKEAGILVQHSGTVTCLSFSPNGSHLLSGSEDGSIAVFRTGSWQLEKLLSKAHKGEAVTCLSVHPSGKLAMSVGTDATLRTWNLVKGRQAYATNLGKNRTGSGRAVSCLLWSPDGGMYVIAIGTEVNVYSVSTAGVIYTFQLKKKVTCICFTKDTELVVGDEGGGLSFHSISDKEQLNAIDAHKQRIKCISCINQQEKMFLASASSDGQIKLWDYMNGKVEEMCSINSDCRITCLVILEGMKSKPVKEEVVETGSTVNSTGGDNETVKSKRARNDSEESSNKRTVKQKSKKKLKSKGPKPEHIRDIDGNEEIVEIDSPHDSTGGDEETVKQVRNDSKESSGKRNDKAKNKRLKPSKSSKKSISFDVVCTSGQKWLVEEL